MADESVGVQRLDTSRSDFLVSADALVLVSLVEQSWNGEWMLTASQKVELYQEIAKDAYINDALTRRDICIFTSKEDNRRMIRTYPRSIRGLLNEDVLNDAFVAFGGDEHRTLSPSEWDAFLSSLERSHLNFLLKESLQNFQAFYGRGQSWWIAARKGGGGFTLSAADLIRAAGHSWTDVELIDAVGLKQHADAIAIGKVSKKPAKMWQIGLDPDGAGKFIPTGWFDDLWYYSSNNHPFHGIFAADPCHRLKRRERIAMELATTSFVAMTLREQDLWVKGRAAPFEIFKDPAAFNVFVAIIGLMIWWLMFLLFTCPCAQVDRSITSLAQVKRAKQIIVIGASLGYLLIALGLVGLLAHVALVGIPNDRTVHLRKIFAGRLRSYAVSWLLMVAMYFNPVVSWGQPEPSSPLCLGDYIGLGQWRVEKQRFQRRCLDALMHAEAFGDVDGGRGVVRRRVEASKTSETFELHLSTKATARQL